jgi:hypothetical protein
MLCSFLDIQIKKYYNRLAFTTLTLWEQAFNQEQLNAALNHKEWIERCIKSLSGTGQLRNLA